MRTYLAISAVLFSLFVAIMPVSLFAAHGDGELININTADIVLLDTLDGIGPARAQDIIDYRTINGLFTTIEDISNVSGIGAPGSSSYEKIKDHITVDELADTSSTGTTTQNQTIETIVTNVTQLKYESVTIQPPQDVHIRVPEKLTTIAGAFTKFEFESYDATGGAVEDGSVAWSFGDGSTATGRDVGHSFLYEGTYIVYVSLKKGSLTDTKTITVTVLPLEASLEISEKGEWVSIFNHSTVPLDVSQWRITTDYQYFIIPNGTYIQGGAQVRFPNEITKLSLLSGTKRAFLKYPNGTIALDSTQEFVEVKEEEFLIEDNMYLKEVTAPEEISIQPIIGHPIIATYVPKKETKQIIETKKEITTNATSSQAAAIILSKPVQAGGSTLYWYIALGAMLLFAIVGILLIRPRKLVVEGYEVIEVKE